MKFTLITNNIDLYEKVKEKNDQTELDKEKIKMKKYYFYY